MQLHGLFCLLFTTVATVYILHSISIYKFYTGSCKNLPERLEDHKNNKFTKGFTKRASDWKVFFVLDNLKYDQARKIEKYIKKMKSKKYIQNLIKHPEISEKLILKFC